MSAVGISPQKLHELATSGASIDLIDVRTPAEFRAVHATVARNVPLDRLQEAELGGETKDRSKALYVICQSGARSARACEQLQASGYTNVFGVEGGTQAWEQAGLPVARGAKAMSLERQVRIAAGSLVLLGVLLAWFVHPYFIGLSAFVGAGLVFAGVTDTCGMALILARMPWNQS